MGMQLEKPELFPDKKIFVGFLLTATLIMLIQLGFSYHDYQTFIEKPFYYTHATVLTSHKKIKNNKRYTVLKLQSDEGFTFYTTNYQKKTLIINIYAYRYFQIKAFLFWII